MKPLATLAVSLLTLAATAAPALARDTYVIDDAHLLSQNAIAQINQQVETLQTQTGKEIVVVTTPSLAGVAGEAALERSFAQLQVNGVEIFIAKDERHFWIAGDTASSRFFPSYQPIYTAMTQYFAQGDYDQGVEAAVALIINTYRGHAASLQRARVPVSSYYTPSVVRSNRGGGMGLIVWIVILAVIFFVIRGIFRAMSGPRSYGPGPGGPGPGYGGPGYGPGGYGPGYGGGFGGGGFWSGLLGGLGGAFLGNELFGNRGGFMGDSSMNAGMGDPGNVGDASGWQSDPGQIDTSNIGGGGWGDSGGGWGGGGDFGGGGGFGGGDSGGGW